MADSVVVTWMATEIFLGLIQKELSGIRLCVSSSGAPADTNLPYTPPTPEH